MGYYKGDPITTKCHILFPFCFYAALAAFAHPRYAHLVRAGGFVHLPPCLKTNWFEYKAHFQKLHKSFDFSHVLVLGMEGMEAMEAMEKNGPSFLCRRVFRL